jgi:PAS domain S-box-containing protein
MKSLELAASYIMIGVSVYIALRNGVIVLRQRANHNHFLFLLLSLAVTGILAIQAVALQAATAQERIGLVLWEVGATCFFFAVLPWLFASYSNLRQRKLLVGSAIFWSVLLGMNLVLIDVNSFDVLHDLVPWGLSESESQTGLNASLALIATIAMWLGMFVVMAYGVYACVSLYRRHDRERAHRLAWSLIVISGLILCGLASRLIDFVHITGYCFFALLVIMDVAVMLDSRNYRRRMLAVLDNLPVAVCLKDVSGRYQLVNRKFEMLFHVKDADVVGRTDFELFSRNKAAALRSSERLALQRSNEVTSDDVRTWQDEEKTYQSQVIALRREDGFPYAVCGVWTDITEIQRRDETLKKIRQQIWHLDRVANTGAITGSLAHELRQPLSAILCNAQAGLNFLDSDPVDLEQIRELLQDIERDDKRAGSIITGMRSFLQDREIPYEDVDLAQCVAEVVDLLHSEIVAYGVEIKSDLVLNMLVRGNKVQIQQVVLNLIMNALEAMADQPLGDRELGISVSRTGKTVLVTFRDSGTGIPEDMLGRVFDGFYTTKPKGLGVGLVVCQSILEAHGGSIWVEPNADRGVAFCFDLPLVAGGTDLEEVTASGSFEGVGQELLA